MQSVHFLSEGVSDEVEVVESLLVALAERHLLRVLAVGRLHLKLLLLGS